MADWSFQRLSVCFILVLTLILILEPSKSSNKISNARSSLVVALKVDKRSYPGRNSSGCSRHSHDSRHPPSCPPIIVTVTAVTVTIIGPFLSFPLQARFSNVLFTRSFMLIWRAKNFFLCASLDSVNRCPRPMPC